MLISILYFALIGTVLAAPLSHSISLQHSTDNKVTGRDPLVVVKDDAVIKPTLLVAAQPLSTRQVDNEGNARLTKRARGFKLTAAQRAVLNEKQGRSRQRASNRGNSNRGNSIGGAKARNSRTNVAKGLRSRK